MRYLKSMNHVVHMILLRGIQLTNVQRCWGTTVKMVFSYKIFTGQYMCGAPERLTEFGARTFLVFLKPLNKRELNTT
jgi:hypothetical protein